MSIINKPIISGSDGILEQLQNGAIINAGGTSHSTFTVGGRGLLFDDGSSTSPGSGTILNSLQGAYDGGATGEILLATNKPFVIQGDAARLEVDISTIRLFGNVFTQSLTVAGNITISGLINGVNVSELDQQVLDHFAGSPALRHSALDVSISPQIPNMPSATNVQEALVALSTSAQGYEYVKSTPSTVWTIQHNKNSRRAQVSIWDNTGNLIIPNAVSIIDANQISVSFTQPQGGTAIIFLF